LSVVSPDRVLRLSDVPRRLLHPDHRVQEALRTIRMLGLDSVPLINPIWDEDARKSAEQYAERLRHGACVQPGAAITRLADETDADLIIMRSHALGGRS
jgi:nucleotide-binding universal stress UspA family protein